MLTESGRNADGLLTTSRPASNTLITHRPSHNANRHPMQLLAPLFDPWLPGLARRRLNRGAAGFGEQAESIAAPEARPDSFHAGARTRHIAAKLAASLAFALVGCATPVLQPSVDVPGRFAAAPASVEAPETVWWDSYGDPVL